MKNRVLIAMFVALGMLAYGGICHAAAFDAFLPSGAKAKGNIVGNKLMLQGKGGKWSPAPDGVYRTGDGRSVVVQGGIVANPGGAIGPIESGVVTPSDLKSKGLPARGGAAMEDKKTKEKVVKEKGGKKGQMVADPATPGQGPVKALPMPQGMQGPAGATPMPQGTEGSMPSPGSPKDPIGPGVGSRPGGGPPPPAR